MVKEISGKASFVPYAKDLPDDEVQEAVNMAYQRSQGIDDEINDNMSLLAEWPRSRDGSSSIREMLLNNLESSFLARRHLRLSMPYLYGFKRD